MKIVVAGGRENADFLIGSLLKNNHKLIVINEDINYCEYLAETHQIPIINGDPCKRYILDEAKISGYDIIIALKADDAENLEICQYAERIFEIKKSVCIVSNPKNVEIFKKLGVNTVISSTYTIANIIEQASTIENLIKILSIEDKKVILYEVLVYKDYPVINRKLIDIKFPINVMICCIVRNHYTIVPNGQTMILQNDKLFVISSPNNQQETIHAISGRNDMIPAQWK